jgi:alpha-tubulin suppressor-like RCC1 family protein
MGWLFDEKSIIKTTSAYSNKLQLIRRLRNISPLARVLKMSMESPPEVVYTSRDMHSDFDPVDMAVTEGSLLILLNNGSLMVRGDNFRGQLGVMEMDHVFTPVQVDFPHQVVQVSGGSNFSIIRTVNGQVYGTGAYNFEQFGQLTSGYNTKDFKIYDSITNFKHVSTGCNYCISIHAGKGFSLFMDKDRKRLFGVGKNTFGQMGISNENQKSLTVPTLVFNLDLVSTDPSEVILKVAPSNYHTLVLTNRHLYFSGSTEFNPVDASMYVDKGFGMLNSYRLNISSILELSGGTRVVDILNNYNNNCALLDNGTAVFFGGRYFDHEFKQMELLTKPDGTPTQLTLRHSIQSSKSCSWSMARNYLGRLIQFF